MSTPTTLTPYEVGQAHAAAGIPPSRCPFPHGSTKWVRYMNGRQSPAQAQPAAVAVEQPAAQPSLFATEAA